ncbi:MAG: hypothetical protein ACOX16_01685 [Candidatus Izemoplasmatales bacterium]|jgi:hypothetical protein
MKKITVLLLLGLIAFLGGCQTETEKMQTTTTPTTSAVSTIVADSEAIRLIRGNKAVEKTIRKVGMYPDISSSFTFFDYLEKARSLDQLAFGFANNNNVSIPYYAKDDSSTWSQMGYWIDQSRKPSNYNPLIHGYLERTFAMPTYLGDSRVFSSGSEPITIISMILGASYAHIDKQNQVIGDNTYDFVKMAMSGYDTGSGLVKNIGAQGQSFWYDIFPQIMFARLYDLYPETEYMKEMVLNGADQWLEALPYFETDGMVNYEFVGFNVVFESPTTVGDHIEPPNGGLAFLFYSAYQLTGDEKYLDGAKEVLDYFQDYQKNPSYEAMTDYAPLVAACLNYQYGTAYDTGKFLDFLFEEDSAFRPGWTVMAGTFGDLSVDGLVGQQGDYAFSMNTFHLASTLAPMVKYDPRYANAVGKYLLHVARNAKVFFPTALPLSRQSMTEYLAYDLYGSIAYEGFKNEAGGIATGDATRLFSQPSDLSLYSSAFIGAFGGMIAETNISGVLKVDLNNTDSYGLNQYPHYLLYNPHMDSVIVRFRGPETAYDVFDKASNTILAKNVSGTINLKIEGNSSLVVVVLPANSSYQAVKNEIFVGDYKLSEYMASVNLPSLFSRQELTEASTIAISYDAPLGDEVTSMKIYFGDILAYDGEPITEFNYNKSILPDTDYEIRVEIATRNGLSDYVTKRVVCR